LILLALFGATSGQAVVWYTGQFFAPIFMQNSLGISLATSNVIMFTALVFATPFFLVWGHLSDRIGRKKIIMAGCLLGVVTYYPLYLAMGAFSSPPNVPVLTALVFVQVFYVTMAYGPIAAMLVEMFPARIRYTALSVPYHLGNGEFGGMTIIIPFLIGALVGNIYAGLIWCVGIPLMTLIVGGLFLKETKDVRIWEEVTPGPAFGGASPPIAAGADVGPTMK
jgi:MFS family permease